jgi:predicted Zn-dependent protease
MEIRRVSETRSTAFWRTCSVAPRANCAALFCVIVVVYFPILARGQSAQSKSQLSVNSHETSRDQGDQGQEFSAAANAELQTGTALTKKGMFREAIPHLMAARGHADNEYAATFNLAVCYEGTRQFKSAISLLNDLRRSHDTVDVENLLSQAYVGDGQQQEAMTALQKAAAFAPQNEKLYEFVSDACMESHDYSLGLKVLDIGLGNLAESPRLHYKKALFLTELDEPDQAKREFDLTGELAPESEIAYMAEAQEELFGGQISDAIRTARAGVAKGYDSEALLAMLGEALIRSGISPGQPEFTEAQQILEKAVSKQPRDPVSLVALGSLELMNGQLEKAINYLERAKQLEPDDPSIYAKLAKAYQRHGDVREAQDALAALESLNREQARRINSAPGERRMSYAGRVEADENSPTANPQ